MSAQILNGKTLASSIRTSLKTKITEMLLNNNQRNPALAVLLVGNNPASETYVKNKKKACEEVGITSHLYKFEQDISEEALLELIDSFNRNENVDGILVQLPLPEHIDAKNIIQAIDPHKDVDGFHPLNIGALALRDPKLRPCTPKGIIRLLEHIEQPFKGQHAVVVGASNIVGRPMALELLLKGATVTICHRFTENLAMHIGQADILISAVGKPGLVKGEWLKQESVAIDVGITRLEDGKLYGDIEFAVALERTSWITPVPGGVGPMTVAMLLENTLEAYSLVHFAQR